MIRSRFGAAALACFLVVAALTGCSRHSKTVTAPSHLTNSHGTFTAGLVSASFPTPGVSLVFGAGIPVTFSVKGANGGDTTASNWVYSWVTSPAVLQVDNNVTTTPGNNIVLLGTHDLTQDSTTLLVSVIDSVLTTVKDPEDSTITHQVNEPRTLATARLNVAFLRAPDRDILGDIRIYHITQSAGGVTALETDTVYAQFLNQDGRNTPLRAGALMVGGDAMSEVHTPAGQYYHGSVTFTVPDKYDVLTLGPIKDPHAFVPAIGISPPGPTAELTLTSPDQRFPVKRSAALSLQWTGGITVPVIENFSPDGGKLGSSVTLRGRNFVYLNNVELDGVPAEYTFLDCDQLLVQVPQNAHAGYGHWSVDNNAGQAFSADSFNVDTVSTSSPSAHPRGLDATTTESDPDHCPILQIELRDVAGNVITLRALDTGRYDLPVSQLSQLVSGMIQVTMTRVLLRELDPVTGFPYDVTFSGNAGLQTLHNQVRFILEHHASFFLN